MKSKKKRLSNIRADVAPTVTDSDVPDKKRRKLAPAEQLSPFQLPKV